MENINYPDFISKNRIPVTPPDSLVDENGKFVFGTFDGPINKINMDLAKKPFSNPLFNMCKLKHMKDWEAIEVAFDEGFVVSAVYNLGFVAFNIIMFYDNATKKAVAWQTFISTSKIKNHNSLINSTKSLDIPNKISLKFENHFEDGKVHFEGNASDKKLGDCQIEIDIESISTPSVVSIPFGINQALYSHKEFFKVTKGKFTIGDREIIANERTVAIIDDHKGYYPYKMHYYWITGMGRKDIDGKNQAIAFNLTQNQSIDPTNYNENLLWLEGVSYPLPPVNFTFEDGAWIAKDEFDMVNVKLILEGSFRMNLNGGLVKAIYHAPFGRYEGYIKDYDGKKYDVSGLSSMGENKTYWM
ncbi:MAG: DUF2804 family protein [Clostridia bacterium]